MVSNQHTLRPELGYKIRETNSITDEATHRHKVDTPLLVWVRFIRNEGNYGSYYRIW